jgi:hypothetical protein
MKILALKNHGTFMSIWLVRFTALIMGFLLVITIFVTLTSTSPSNKPIVQSIVACFITIFLYKLISINIVYLTDNGFKVDGFFLSHYYLYEDYIGISNLFPYAEILLIEFIGGKKYHFIVRDIRAKDIRNLFSDSNSTINELNSIIEEYRKNNG